jgi:TPR repeat protein
MLELGVGTEPKADQAVALYQLAAEGGSAPAQNRLGLLYLEGVQVLQDYEEGARFVCEAADAGDDNGQFNCALVLLEGRGVEADAAKAISYAEKAADAGNIGAMNLLGQSYITGTGVEADDVKALEYFQQTASKGNPVGLFSLGQAYAEARQTIEAELNAAQVTEAQRFARAWRPEEDATPAETVSE